MKKTKDRQIIIVTGTPGVGKTSVSNQLAEDLKAVHLDLANTVKDLEFYLGKDPKRDTLIVDLKRLVTFVNGFLRKIDSVTIISGHYAVDVVSPARNVAVFVLRCEPQELKKRLEDKSYDSRKIDENVEAEILDVCFVDAVNAFGLENVYEIDTTHRGVNGIAVDIERLLKGKKQSEKKIDWLGRLEKEGRLNEFFK
jgi:adenylate kinase